MQLQKIDYQILSILSQNSRINFKQISETLKISAEVASYRIANLEDRKIIKDYMLLIDARKLGFVRSHILLRLKGDQKIKQLIYKKLSKINFVMWINSFIGSYDFQVILDTENPYQLNQVILEINKLCSGNLLDYQILTHLHDCEFTNQIPPLRKIDLHKAADDSTFSNFFSSRSFAVPAKFELFKYKLLDLKILKALADSPNISISNLSDIVGSDRVTTKKRIMELINSKVIISFATILNLKEFNRITHYFLLKLRPNVNTKDINLAFKSLNNVFYSGRMLGAYDLIVYLNSESSSELYSSIEILKNHLEKYIIRSEILVVDEIYHWRHVTEGILNSCRQRIA